MADLRLLLTLTLVLLDLYIYGSKHVLNQYLCHSIVVVELMKYFNLEDGYFSQIYFFVI